MLLKPPQPFIVIGMHRSGTSLLARVLEDAGIFMGVIKDHNFEAMHFLSLNQQTLWAAGASWLTPVVPEKLYWKTMPAGVLFDEHFKLTGRFQRLWYRMRGMPWGWKDPRNTFTLPMWLHHFPGARVIHLWRDEEEVARSLQKRNRLIGEVQDPRLEDLDFNRQLARQYREQAHSYAAQLGPRFLELNYADMLSRKPAFRQKLQQFTGRPVGPALDRLVRTR